jgi:flagellar biosynthesis GTPase FlhF
VPIKELDMDTTIDCKTFRGRTLDEVLPQIRAELGPDAIVVRRREGLAGGVAGFFQRSYVEVDARPGLPAEVPFEARNDRATAEGLSSPAIKALLDQASPFADELARAAAFEPDDPGLYGPQPNHAAIAAADDPTDFVARPAHETSVARAEHDRVPPADDDLVPPAPADDHVPAAHHDLVPPPHTGLVPPAPADDHVPAAHHDLVPPPHTGLVPPRPAAADAVEQQLVAAGLSAPFAADLVGEAVAHGLPFGHPRGLKRLVRTALARRMRPIAALGPGSRTVALVGAGGAGRSAVAERLAAAYAHADAEVVVVALRAPDGGTGLAARLQPLGVSVIAADDAQQAARRLARRPAALTIVEAPATGPGDRSDIARLAGELRSLRVDEIHLALPATLSAAAADELSDALGPLGVTHGALTHADQTTRPGAPIELAIAKGRALSYVCSRDAIELADPDALAKQLLP